MNKETRRQTKYTTSLTASRTPVILWTLGNLILPSETTTGCFILYSVRSLLDVSELQCAYGELKNTGDDARFPTEQGNDKAMTGHDQAEILALKDNQIADLRNQLDKAEAQLQIATTEKSKLLDLLSAEKEEKARTYAPSRRKREIFQLAAP